MKTRLLIPALLFAIPFCANAQSSDDDETNSNHNMITKVVDMYNTEFQWDEFKEKTGKAIVRGNYIELEAKKGAVSTCTELPINMEKDIFTVRLYMEADQLDNEGYVGFVFDKDDADNYKMFTLTKKSYEVSYVKDGKTTPKHKGMYKFFPYKPDLDKDENISRFSNGNAPAIQLPGSKKILVLKISRRGNALSFNINGIDLYNIKNIGLNSPVFGYVASEGHRLRGYGLIFSRMQLTETDN